METRGRRIIAKAPHRPPGDLMSQPTPQHTPEDARDLLDRNVRRSVAVSTLRKIRRIVDDFEDQDRRNARASRRIAIAVVITVCAVLVVLMLTGGALPRLLTGLLKL
jgi:hypothetical protein